ncbi:MAG: TldD/PmbA family protein [Pseudomonadota bacterium]
MTTALDDISEQLLAAARKQGADGADAVVMRRRSVTIDIREGALEQAERAEALNLGLRVMVGQRQASVSTTDASARTIEEMAMRAVAMAREAPEDPNAGLAEVDLLSDVRDAEGLELADPAPEPSAEALQADAEAAEAAARAVGGVTQVQTSSATYSHSDRWLAASNGFAGGYARTGRSLGCVAISGSGTGMERDYSGDSRTFQADLRAASEIGQEAGERAVERRGARKPPTGTYPVLFDERIAASLIGHLLAASNGAAVARGATWLRDKLGAQILPDGLDLIEDPHRARASASRPFDGEGLRTAPRKIVDNGRLTGWTLDLATARKLGMVSTGNAVRGASGGPSPSVSNVALTQGEASRADLIRDMGTGLLVTSMIGATINPNTGDYSRGASGHWVENGEIAYPVNECTIAGNLLDMLTGIVPANDARTYLSRVVPSLLVPGLTLAGS